MTSDRPQTPAELAAAGICWNTRWRGRGSTPPAVITRVEGFWHDSTTTCRWCAIPPDELLELIRAGLSRVSQEQEDSFRRMSHAQRLVRVREAQETPWWEEAQRL